MKVCVCFANKFFTYILKNDESVDFGNCRTIERARMCEREKGNQTDGSANRHLCLFHLRGLKRYPALCITFDLVRCAIFGKIVMLLILIWLFESYDLTLAEKPTNLLRTVFTKIPLCSTQETHPWRTTWFFTAQTKLFPSTFFSFSSPILFPSLSLILLAIANWTFFFLSLSVSLCLSLTHSFFLPLSHSLTHTQPLSPSLSFYHSLTH